MCVLIFWSSYIHNWVEICLQFGWNIFTTGLKYFWKSYRSQWAFIFWSRGIQKGIQNEYSQFFWNISWKFKYDLNWVEIFLKILPITIRLHFLKLQYSQCVSSFFSHNVSGFVLISEYKNWWLPIFKITIFEELVIQWSSNSWWNFYQNYNIVS